MGARKKARTIVCLCGSMRFRKQLERAAYDQTMLGRIVLMPHVYESDGQLTVDERKALLALHDDKIRMADEVLVVMVGGYIGPTVMAQIWRAKDLGIRVVQRGYRVDVEDV